MRFRNALLVMGLIALLALPQSARAGFINGDFEIGPFTSFPPTGWTASTFLNASPGLTCPSSGPCNTFTGSSIVRTGGAVQQSLIVNAPTETGMDSNLGPLDSLRYPKFGMHAVRVNGDMINNIANSLAQTMTVVAGDVDPIDGLIHVRFAFAPVLENPPGHAANEQPWFYIALKNVTTGTTFYEKFVFSNQAGAPWKTSSKAGSDVLYTDWQIVDVAPGPSGIAVGNTISLEVIGADCSMGGHFGYVYVDGFGSQLPGLSVVKTGPATVQQGSNMTYSFVYKNLGASPAAGVVVTEKLPSPTTFVSVSDITHCTPGSGVVTCNFGTLAPGTVGTFQITVAVPANATGPLVNGTYSIKANGISEIFGPPVTTDVTLPSCAHVTDSALCATDGSGSFTYTFQFQNLTTKTINHVFLTPQGSFTVNPDYVDLTVQPTPAVPYPRPIPPGAMSGPLTVTLKGASPGSVLALELSFFDENLDQCCLIEQVIPLPTCDCAQLLQTSPACKNLLSSAGFNFSFVVQNLTPGATSEILITPVTPPTVVIQKDQFAVPLPTIGSKSPLLSINVSGPGALSKPVCMLVSLHDKQCDHCCSIEQCVTPTECFFYPNLPIGSAQIYFSESQVVVTGFDSSGDDGVAVSLGQATKFTTAWLPLDAGGPLPDGARLILGSGGQMAGQGDHNFGSLTVTQTGGEHQIAAEFGDLGAATQRITVLKQGVVVATITGHSGPVAKLAGWPSGGGILRLPQGASGFFLDRPDTTWQIVGGPAVVGDEIQVTAEAAPSIDFFSVFSLRAADIPAIVLVSEDEEGATPPDLNLSLSTGFDQATGSLLPPGSLPNGTADDDWHVSTGGDPAPAKLVINRPKAWPAPLATSAWISVNPAGGRSLPGVNKLQFENCFCIGPLATNVALDLQLFADDQGTVLLNGNLIGGPGGSFSSPAPLAVHLTGRPGDGLFQAGRNCLAVTVDDLGGATGLDLAGAVQATQGVCF